MKVRTIWHIYYRQNSQVPRIIDSDLESLHPAGWREENVDQFEPRSTLSAIDKEPRE